MEENQPEKTPKRNSGLLIVLLILIGALAGSTGYFAFQWQHAREALKTVQSEKIVIEKRVDEYVVQLEILASKYDSLIAIHESLKTELIAEREKVIQLKREYDAYRAQGGSSFDSPEPGQKSFRARFEELKSRFDENEALILQLKAKNQELTAENFRATKKVEEITIENTRLAEENTKLTKTVDVAKRLKTYEIYSDAVRVSGGGKKEKQTNKAKNANRLRSCFTVLDNQIAEKGEKSIYLVFIDPEGRTLTDGERSKLTLLNGDEIAYSVKKDIFYDNKVMQLCLNWDIKEDLTAGKYKVQIYADGVLVGKDDFDLK